MDTQNDGSRSPHNGRGDGSAQAVRSGLGQMGNINIWPMPNAMEAVAGQARQVTERFSRTLGFSGEEGELLSLQTRRDMTAVKQCNTVLTQSYRDASRGWLAMVEGQWNRTIGGMNRLTKAKSVQEFGMIQGQLIRENLEHLLKNSRTVAQGTMRVSDEAGKAFAD